MKFINYILYRLKWRLAKYFNFKSPVHVDIELTTRCNLNCKICFRREHKVKDMDMNLLGFYHILRKCVEIRVKSVKVNWRGEPTLNYIHSDIAQKNFYTMMNTRLNGALYLEWLKEYDNLKVSLDSTGDMTEVVLNNLKQLPNAIIQRRTTKNSLETEKEFVRNIRAFGLKNKIIQAPAMERNKQGIFEPNQYKKRVYCGQPSRRLVIGADGKVFACCCAYSEPEELYLGDIKEQSLSEIWNSEKRKGLVEDLKNGIYPNTCLRCVSRETYK